jgi:hypothetical protein
MTKESLIKEVNVISGFVFLLLVVFSCNAQKKYMENNQVTYKIIFGDGFNNDTIKLSINGMIVFQKDNFLSDKSDGVTNCWVNISEEKEHFFVSTSQDKNLKQIGLIFDEIKLNLSYKGKTTDFQVNKKDGMYIVVSDDRKGNLTFSQSKDRPVFD